MELHVLEANYYASKVAVENGHDVVDLHYFMRHQIHRRAEDGIHWDMTGHRRITNFVLTHIAQTWGIKLPKHIKMNIDIDTYEIDLDSEKPTPNQYEMNKLEGNQKSGKSIFDVKLNESGKPENDGLVEVEVPKAKPSSKSNSPTKRNKKMRGKQWKNKRRSHVPTDTNPYHQTFEYNHQQQGIHNFPPQNQPRNSPQFAPYTQLFSTLPFCSLQFSPSDQSHYFLRYKVRPLARPARRTSNGDWSLTQATSAATLNKWAGWFTDRPHRGDGGSQTPRGACFLERL
jgi:hypothetical protein